MSVFKRPGAILRFLSDHMDKLGRDASNHQPCLSATNTLVTVILVGGTLSLQRGSATRVGYQPGTCQKAVAL